MRPTAFISSTFYDLKHVRASLNSALRNLSFDVLDSTDPEFFASPEVNTIENCKTNVRNCDVLILIIGGRYGGIVTDRGQSVTNLEYLWAHSNNIPVYTFVDRRVWEIYGEWAATGRPVASRKGSAIDYRVFPFLEHVSRSRRANWIWKFDSAEEIVEVLKNQFSSLLREKLTMIRQGVTETARTNRSTLMANYHQLVRSSSNVVQMMGVSLITVARSFGVLNALKESPGTCKIQVLILSPSSQAASIRAEEEYGHLNLGPELEASLEIWRGLMSEVRNLEVRKYSTTPRLFWFRTDDIAYFSTYPHGRSSVDVPTIEIRDVEMINTFCAGYFDATWDKAEII